jgi:8-oxo-dGTP diphosphatase
MAAPGQVLPERVQVRGGADVPPPARPQPKVGVTLLVVKHGRVLLARRQGSHGAGEFGTPGGGHENGESYEETALRELREECGPDFLVTTPRFLCLTNLRRYLPKHYADVGMVAHWISGDAEPPTEEERAKLQSDWGWYSMYDLPAPVFGAVRNLVEAYRTGRPFFDE